MKKTAAEKNDENFEIYRRTEKLLLSINMD